MFYLPLIVTRFGDLICDLHDLLGIVVTVYLLVGILNRLFL